MKKNIIIVIILTISLFLLSSCKKDNRIEIKCEETGIDVLYAGIAYDIDDFILVDNIDNYKVIEDFPIILTDEEKVTVYINLYNDNNYIAYKKEFNVIQDEDYIINYYKENNLYDGDSIKISNRTFFEVIYKDYNNEISLYRYLRDIKSTSDNYKTIIIKYDTRAEKFYCNYQIQKDNAFTEIGYNFEPGDLYSNIKKMKLVGNQLNLKEEDLRKEVALNISQIEKEFNFFKSINWNSLYGKED